MYGIASFFDGFAFTKNLSTEKAVLPDAHRAVAEAAQVIFTEI